MLPQIPFEYYSFCSFCSISKRIQSPLRKSTKQIPIFPIPCLIQLAMLMNTSLTTSTVYLLLIFNAQIPGILYPQGHKILKTVPKSTAWAIHWSHCLFTDCLSLNPDRIFRTIRTLEIFVNHCLDVFLPGNGWE